MKSLELNFKFRQLNKSLSIQPEQVSLLNELKLKKFDSDCNFWCCATQKGKKKFVFIVDFKLIEFLITFASFKQCDFCSMFVFWLILVKPF